VKLRRRASLALGVGRDLLLAVVACGTVLLVLLSLQLGYTERQLRERSLAEAAEYVTRRLQPGPDGRMRLPNPAGSSWALFGYPVVVFDNQGKVLLQRPELDPAILELLARQRLAATETPHPLGSIRVFQVSLGDQEIIGATLRAGAGREAVFVTVFKDESAPDVLVDDVVREFPYRSLQVIVPIFALLLLGGGWVIWHRTRPIARVAAIAGTIGPDTLDRRLPEEGLPTEVQPIVNAVNGALERLQAAAGAQREFLRRAAHHLRTPLTVLSARAASLDDSEMAAQLRGDVAEIARIISQLLRMNEIDTMPEQAGMLADLGAVGEAVRQELAERGARQGLRVELNVPEAPVLVRGDPNVIEVAVANLVENALQHSPPGEAVVIVVAPDACIGVADRGPGVPADLRGKIFEPFWSGDPHGVRPGLGLAIVRRVTDRCGATITVGSGAKGGAVFELRFLPAPEDMSPAAAAADRTAPASLLQRRRLQALERAAG
jgi:two-component system, OmpR family, sensor histidine kinase TctE